MQLIRLNSDNLPAQIISEGLASARPAAAIAGRLYFETDTATLCYDTGTAWATIGTFTASGIGLPTPTAGELLVGQTGGSWSAEAVSGDATITSGGAVTVEKINGTAPPTCSVAGFNSSGQPISTATGAANADSGPVILDASGNIANPGGLYPQGATPSSWTGNAGAPIALSSTAGAGAGRTILFDAGLTGKSRLGAPINTTVAFHLAANGYFDGTNWQRDDTTLALIDMNCNATAATWGVQYAAAGSNPATLTHIIQLSLSTGALTLSGNLNYISSETGANNAIAGAITNVTLAAGVRVTIKIAHTLQAGANTFNFNSGGAVSIKSHNNPSNNIGTAYASGALVDLMYDGTVWQDMSQ